MLNTAQWESLNALISSLYGIKNTTAMRKAFLSKLNKLIEFDFSDFNLSKYAPYEGAWLENAVVFSIFNKDVEDAFTKLYEEKYYKMDYVSWIFAHHESIAYRESDLISKEIRKNSKFYKDYLSVYDLGSVAGVSIISAGQFAGAVTLYKSEKKGDFSDKDIYILEMLLPHLQNALRNSQEAKEKDTLIIEKHLKYQYGITKKEFLVISLILEGYSNNQIGNSMKIKLNTVKSHISNIFEKIGVSSRSQLIIFLIKKQLLIL